MGRRPKLPPSEYYDYNGDGDDEYDGYEEVSDDDMPECCTACGGPYPDCMSSCPIFDD